MVSSDIKPAMFRWDASAEVMVPLLTSLARCRAQYVDGERYALTRYDERSEANHNHFFACVKEAFETWPDDYAIDIVTAEQLRKLALIKTGHYDQHIMVLANAEAVHEYVAGMTEREGYAEFSVHNTAVVARFAKTQKKKVMGNDEFKQSKQDVLEFMALALGITVEALVERGRQRVERRKLRSAA